MAEANLFTQLEETIEAVKRWYARTEAEYHTLDNLKSYLVRNGKPLPFPPREEKETWELEEEKETRELRSLKMLAQLLEVKGLSFKLTPTLVDAVVRPLRMYDIEWDGYQFFLEHYHEHPLLEEFIRRSISDGGLRLRVKPVIPVDGNLMAWLFDPWEMKTYKFSRNDGSSTDIRVRRKRGRVISVAAHSICEEYRGPCRPFSRQYMKRVEEAKQAAIK